MRLLGKLAEWSLDARSSQAIESSQSGSALCTFNLIWLWVVQGSGGQHPGEWQEVSNARVWCFGCLQPLAAAGDQQLTEDPGVVVRCPECLRAFCFDCDAFVHESLHNCPGCECAALDDDQVDGQ